MATYTELVDKVLDWSNRDTNVLSVKVIKDCINYAADDAYRSLRVVPLEKVQTYTLTASDKNKNQLSLPSDTISFIELNLVITNSQGIKEYYPYSSKLDIRSFREVVEALDHRGYSSTKRTGQRGPDGPRFWTRDRGNITIYPPFVGDETFELHYYRRLPEADARYTITESQYSTTYLVQPDSDELAKIKEADMSVTTLTPDDSEYYTIVELINGTADKTEWAADEEYVSGDEVKFKGVGYTALGAVEADLDEPDINTTDWSPDADTVFNSTDEILGGLTANWLRDENEKILLFGALSQAFDYLAEPEERERYMQKYMMEVEKLNKEDKQRMPTGGTAVTIFTSNLL